MSEFLILHLNSTQVKIIILFTGQSQSGSSWSRTAKAKVKGLRQEEGSADEGTGARSEGWDVE